MTVNKIQSENEEILAELKHYFPNYLPRLTMTQNSNVGFRGLHIHMGLGKDHFVADEIRDVKVLIEIVRAFGAAHLIGHNEGIEDNRNAIISALGITIEGSGSLVKY
jgi:hypothetical protein